MRLRGPHLIGQANLNTSVRSQSGTIAGGGAVLVSFSAYTFLFAAKVAPPILNQFGPWFQVSPPITVDADAPEWSFQNLTVNPTDYGVEWRHVNP